MLRSFRATFEQHFSTKYRSAGRERTGVPNARVFPFFASPNGFVVVGSRVCVHKRWLRGFCGHYHVAKRSSTPASRWRECIHLAF
jgi:hypothetical protein